MTFNDGIIHVYRVTNEAENGAMPVPKPALLFSEYFGFDILGVTRYFTALQANQQLELVVNIPGWPGARVTDYAELDDGIEDHAGVRFRVVMVQQQKDDNGLNMTRLSLERFKG